MLEGHVVGSLLAVICAAAPAAAQTAASGAPAPARPAQATPAAAGDPAKGSVEGGVDLGLWVRNRGETVTYKSGWYAGGSYHVVRAIHLVGMVGADYRSATGYTANITTYSGDCLN